MIPPSLHGRRKLDGPPSRISHQPDHAPAERRPTHLSLREIGDRLYVSRNTIKTQAISIYRKLGVSSRSGAIDRMHELGLLEQI